MFNLLSMHQPKNFDGMKGLIITLFDMIDQKKVRYDIDGVKYIVYF